MNNNDKVEQQRKIIIIKTISYIKKELKNAEGGHDWSHTNRVLNLAKSIAKKSSSENKEKIDMFIIELGSLLHDIADSKFNNGNEELAPNKARNFLSSINVDESTITHIVKIIENISYRSSLGKKQTFSSLELKIIQDADRLDALGAIGIARAFSYGGYKERSLYDPEIKPVSNMTKDEYKNNKGPTVNHFYEKLFLLKDKMNTTAGKKIAKKRELFMKEYLEQFYSEWESRDID